jgi:hypothetical protein
MSEAKLSKTKISIRRLIVLFLLVNGAIAAVAVVCIVGLAMMPRIQAFTWHLRNGDHVTLGGHRFAVPATYGVEVSESELHIEIMQTPGMIKSGLGGVTIESKGKVLDGRNQPCSSPYRAKFCCDDGCQATAFCVRQP